MGSFRTLKLNRTPTENCMSRDLSPCRTHSTIPFHHSSPVIVDYQIAQLTRLCCTILGVSEFTGLEWNGRMEWWNGMVEWTGMVEWNGRMVEWNGGMDWNSGLEGYMVGTCSVPMGLWKLCLSVSPCTFS